MTFRVSYMTGECWETFSDGFTCSTSPHEILDADWSGLINSVTCLKYLTKLVSEKMLIEFGGYFRRCNFVEVLK